MTNLTLLIKQIFKKTIVLELRESFLELGSLLINVQDNKIWR